MVAVSNSFLRRIEVGPLHDINFGINNDNADIINLQIKEPRVQTRLCLAGHLYIQLNVSLRVKLSYHFVLY